MGEPWPRRWLTYQTNTDQSSDKEPHADSCDKEVTGSIPRPRLLTPRHLGPFSVDSACSSRVSCVRSPQVLHLPQHAHRYNWQSCKCRWLMVFLCGPAANWWLVTFALNQLVHSNDPLDSERRTTERLSKQECAAALKPSTPVVVTCKTPQWWLEQNQLMFIVVIRENLLRTLQTLPNTHLEIPSCSSSASALPLPAPCSLKHLLCIIHSRILTGLGKLVVVGWKCNYRLTSYVS